MIGRDNKNGPQGDGINEDVSFTLNTVDRHAVYAMTTGSFTQVAEDKAPTVLARDYKDPTAVCYGIGRDTFNQGRNAKFAPTFEEELQPTLVAKGPGAIQSGYTVRRLTPTECARLQGSQTGGAMTWALPNLLWRISVIGMMCLKPIAGLWEVPQSPSH
jgi:DNA (cytosine-5)-methyltransferase 1